MSDESNPICPKTSNALDNSLGDATEESATPLDLILVDAEGLGRLLELGRPDQPGSAAKAVNERIYRRTAMPPGMMIPGSKKRLWRVSAVLIWMSQFEGQRGSIRSRQRKRSRKGARED